jgi:hypothetical protein
MATPIQSFPNYAGTATYILLALSVHFHRLGENP